MENNNVAENSGTQMVTPEPTYMLIAMDNAVVFPGHLTSLSVGKQSADALVNAAAVGGEVFFVYSPSVGDNGMPANIDEVELPLEMLHSMGMIPCGYHRYYYMHEEMLAQEIADFGKGECRAEVVKKTEDELFELYKDPNLDHKPEQLAKRGGAHYSDAACETIAAIYNDRHEHMVVSTQNNGAVPDLAPDSIVEVSALIGRQGAEPIAWGPMPSQERGWLQCMKAMEECVIEAALTGDYGKALEAFCLNPQVENGKKAQRVLDELLVAHEKYLPQFAEKIAELKAAGVTVTDPTAARLVAEGK